MLQSHVRVIEQKTRQIKIIADVTQGDTGGKNRGIEERIQPSGRSFQNTHSRAKVWQGRFRAPISPQ